jgi:S-adenosylmethionine:tRNA ribosyltransferase-isomerase
MKLSDFNYKLDERLIAQRPARPRDAARLLVVNKDSTNFTDKYFYNITDHLEAGDLLIINDSKVIPARLIGKKESGGKVEILLLNNLEKSSWEVIGKNIPAIGQKIIFSKSFQATVIKKDSDSVILNFNCQGNLFWSRLNSYGQMPLPPYIKSSSKKLDSERYQTVYADKRDYGSVAAPTAGLHFTPRLLKALKQKGVKIAKITLHVGLGTFRPIKTNNILDHKMHSEWVSVSSQVIKIILETKKKNKKIIAVGTTSVRAIETAMKKPNIKKTGFTGLTNIFIYPPYKFKAIDGLITNFHLPKSTLLLLVSALAGKQTIKKAYQEAIKKKYRFYSYGDAMLIL